MLRDVGRNGTGLFRLLVLIRGVEHAAVLEVVVVVILNALHVAFSRYHGPSLLESVVGDVRLLIVVNRRGRPRPELSVFARVLVADAGNQEHEVSFVLRILGRNDAAQTPVFGKNNVLCFHSNV